VTYPEIPTPLASDRLGLLSPFPSHGGIFITPHPSRATDAYTMLHLILPFPTFFTRKC